MKENGGRLNDGGIAIVVLGRGKRVFRLIRECGERRGERGEGKEEEEGGGEQYTNYYVYTKRFDWLCV